MLPLPGTPSQSEGRPDYKPGNMNSIRQLSTARAKAGRRSVPEGFAGARTAAGRGPARRGGSIDEGGRSVRVPPVDSIPISISIRHPAATVSRRHPQPRKSRVRLCLFSPEGAPSLLPLQPRRGAIPQPRAAPWVPGIPQILSPKGAPYLAARCPWTVGMPPRQGSISFWIPFPGRCPGLRNGRAFSAPRRLAFATSPAGSLPQESRDPFCSPDAETIETETPTELTCAL